MQFIWLKTEGSFELFWRRHWAGGCQTMWIIYWLTSKW